MDTQDRIILNKSGRYETYLFKDILEEEIIFSFKEFEKVIIELKCNKDSYIEFEYSNDDELKRLYTDQTFILNDYEYDRDSTDNKTFYPSKYYISINSGKTKKECYFNVESNALGDKIDDIRKIVSDFSKGLELDLFNNNRGKEFADTNESYYIPLYDKIVSSEKMLQFEINYILKHPIEHLEKTIQFTQKPTKETRKKIKYEIKKGLTVYSGKKTIQEKKSVSIKNKENYLLKKSLKKVIETCTLIDKHFGITIAKLQEAFNEDNRQMEEISKKKAKLDSDKHDQKYQRRIYAEYKQLEENIDKHSFEQSNLEAKRNIINKIRNNFLSLITESWIGELDESSHMYDCAKFVRNVHYKKIIDFAKTINANFDSRTKKNRTYAYKKTAKLYEIYVLILIFKIFQKNGFTFECEADYDFNLLFENQEYIFHNGNKSIRMIYDQMVKGTDESPRDELANQNSTSNKPDIIIMFYEDGLIKNCIIVEIKCRRKHNIYVKTGDTPVFSQLKDYTNFWYFDSEGNLDRNVLKKVYAIFPQENTCKDDLNANQICLLSLNPVYDYENDSSYLNLFNEITSYI